MNDLDKCFQVQKQLERQRKVLASNPIAGFKKQMELSQNMAAQVVPSYLKDLHGYPFNKSLTLSDEERYNILQAPVSDSALIINHLDSVLKEKQALMDRQVKSLEHIAEQAYAQATSAEALCKTVNTIALNAENQSRNSSQIAESAKRQADVAVAISKKRDLKGWISVGIAALCAFMEFAVHHDEIIGFVMNILAR